MNQPPKSPVVRFVANIELGNTGAVVEHAAERGRARPAIEHAAGRMRELERIDLAPPWLGVHRDRKCHESKDDSDHNAPRHATRPQISALRE